MKIIYSNINMIKKKKEYEYFNSDKPSKYEFKKTYGWQIDHIIDRNKDILNTPSYGGMPALSKKGLERNSNLSDAEGLSKAYDADNRVYVDGNKMYIAGTEPSPLGSLKNTKNWLRDWKDNLTKIPTGTYERAFKYKNADDVLSKNPQVDHLIGHSAGGTTVLELNKNYNNKYKTTTYSAPVLDLGLFKDPINDNHLRFKTQGDVVAALDKQAITITKPSMNPLTLHAFDTGYGDTGKTGGGQVNYQIM
jgi:hypothetical protein